MSVPLPAGLADSLAPGRLRLYLDFDGTLAPIVEHPARARLPAPTREVLRSLSVTADIVIVSGRGLEDVKRLVDLPLIYAGDHGLEIEGRGIAFREPRAAALAGDLRAVCESLAARLDGVPGAFVELKGLTASVHFRLTPEPEVPRVKAAAAAAIEERAGFRLAAGKRVVEIRPRIEWDKGSAARWIDARLGPPAGAVICAGDDRTDEDMFAAFPDAVTIRIGRHPESVARYWVESPQEFQRFLVTLRPPAEPRENRAGSPRSSSPESAAP